MPPSTEDIRAAVASADIVADTIAERGKIYGDPRESHTNIGLSWTGLIQQHYGITLNHPLPAALVAQMMVAFKMQRAARVYHADNYVDAHAYTKFADEFQNAANDDIEAGRERERQFLKEQREIVKSICKTL